MPAAPHRAAGQPSIGCCRGRALSKLHEDMGHKGKAVGHARGTTQSVYGHWKSREMNRTPSRVVTSQCWDGEELVSIYTHFTAL